MNAMAVIMAPPALRCRVLLVTDVTTVTMDLERRVVHDAAVAIDGARIAAVGKATDLATRYPGADVLDGRGMLAVPGLVDAHAHADQSLLRGWTDDLTWVPFLAEWIDPYLRERDPAVAIAAYRLTMLEMLCSGTTCFVSPNVDPRDDLDGLVGAIEEMGLRAVLAHWVDAPAALDRASAAVERWNGAATGRVQLRFGLDIPRLPGDRYQPSLYGATAARARELGSGIVSHFCSETEDWTYYEDHFGLRPTQWAEREGILGPTTLLINGCWLTAVEAGILAATGTPVVASPTATMKMASGTTRVRDLRDAGVTVALGTDGAANNNSFDMVREMKAACVAQNADRGRAGTLTAEDALELATIEGARALGLEDELGSLEPGKRADVVLVDLRHAHTWPVHDPVSNLVYAAAGRDVDTVIIDGRVLVRGGEPVAVDVARVLDDAATASGRVAGLLPTRGLRWPHE
jgi:cytosine/adenosine deaminase-related metal-dependent hydrolase